MSRERKEIILSVKWDYQEASPQFKRLMEILLSEKGSKSENGTLMVKRPDIEML